MEFRYTREPTQGRNLDCRIVALLAQSEETILCAKASWKSLKGRSQNEKAINALGNGDTLLIAEWDGATRSMIARDEHERVVKRIRKGAAKGIHQTSSAHEYRVSKATIRRVVNH